MPSPLENTLAETHPPPTSDFSRIPAAPPCREQDAGFLTLCCGTCVVPRTAQLLTHLRHLREGASLGHPEPVGM